MRAGRVLTIRVGRQEMTYGSSRLVSVREGPNVRQSFDAVKAFYQTPRGQVDAFVSRPVQTDRGVFDDAGDRNRRLWGLYAVRELPGFLDSHLDLYYLGFTEKSAAFESGTADERRHSLGLRWWSQAGRLRYNLEAVYQSGSFGSQAIRAYTLSGEFTYTLHRAGWKPFFNPAHRRPVFADRGVAGQSLPGLRVVLYPLRGGEFSERHRGGPEPHFYRPPGYVPVLTGQRPRFKLLFFP
jgi:hypothetical protein